MSARNDQPSLPQDARDQNICLHRHVDERNPDQLRVLLNPESHSLYSSVHQTVQRLHVAVQTVIRRTDILDNPLCCEKLRVHHTVQLKGINDLIEIHMVYLRDHLFSDFLLCKERENRIDLINSGAGHKGICVLQIFLHENFLIASICTVNICLREDIIELRAPLWVFLNDLDINPVFQKNLRQIIGNLSSSDDGAVLNPVRRHTDFPEKGIRLQRFQDYRQNISGCRCKITVRYHDFVASLRNADQHAVIKPL